MDGTGLLVKTKKVYLLAPKNSIMTLKDIISIDFDEIFHLRYFK